MESLTNELKLHSELDDKIKLLNNQVHILRKQRNVLEDTLVSQITHMKLDYKKLKFGNNTYIVSNTKEKPTLTNDIIKQVAAELIGEVKALELINKINEYRDANKKQHSILKRTRISHKKTMRKNMDAYKNNHLYSLKNKEL
jgi:hypothetical protein